MHYNCSKKQHKRIPAAVQTGNRSISQRSALKLHWQTTQTYSCSRPDRQRIYITAQFITIAVTSNRNLFLPPSRPSADLHHSAVHYNCNKKQTQTYSSRCPEWQQIYITAQCITIVVNSNTNIFTQHSRMAAILYHRAVHYNCTNKQHKNIRATVQTSSKSISQRSSLQLQLEATQTYSSCRPDRQQIYITSYCIIIEVTNNTKIFLPPSRSAEVLYHSAVHYNCSNKQHKLIPPAVKTGSRSISQRSALQLQ